MEIEYTDKFTEQVGKMDEYDSEEVRDIVDKLIDVFNSLPSGDKKIPFGDKLMGFEKIDDRLIMKSAEKNLYVKD